MGIELRNKIKMASEPTSQSGSERSEHEKLYSPSEWSKRFGPDEVIDEHIRTTTKQSNCNRIDIPSNLKVSYRSNQENIRSLSGNTFHGTTLDIFGIDLEKTSPIFVYFSGGYWQALSGEVSSYPAGPLHRNGVVSVIVDYDRAPRVNLDEIVKEAIDAMDWIVKYAVENKSRSISLCGHSAGAQLCAMVVASNWFKNLPVENKNLFKGIFLMAGVYDLRPLVSTYVNDPLQLSDEDAARNSPLISVNQIADNLSMRTSIDPIHVDLIVGENDSPAFKEQNKSFAHELNVHLEKNFMSKNNVKTRNDSCTNGIRITESIVPDVDHFNLVENLRNNSYEVVKRILNIIKT